MTRPSAASSVVGKSPAWVLAQRVWQVVGKELQACSLGFIN